MNNKLDYYPIVPLVIFGLVGYAIRGTRGAVIGGIIGLIVSFLFYQWILSMQRQT